MTDTPPSSIELVGDGDEIAAIEDVETEFHIKLDPADAPTWITTGDVYRSLNKARSSAGILGEADWNQFAVAICRETGINPVTIGRETLLLGEPNFWSNVTRACGRCGRSFCSAC
jgi:hypothetical protein